MLTDMPAELWLQIAGYLNKPSLANLRLVCRLAAANAATALFSTLTLDPFYSSRIKPKLEVLKDQHIFSKMVKDVEVRLRVDTEEDRVVCSTDFVGRFDMAFIRSMCELVFALSTLTSFRLEYDDRNAQSSSYRWSDVTPKEVNPCFLKALRERQNSNPIRALTIGHLKDACSIDDTSALSYVLGTDVQLGHLSLRIHNEAGFHAGLEYNLVSDPYWHNFTRLLPSVWSKDAAANLKHLELIFDSCVGYYPRFDLSRMKLPKIEVLKLKRFSFSQDPDLNGILGLGGTLKELWLSHCPIIVHAMTMLPLDPQGYPNYDGIMLRNCNLYAYGSRWSTYFNTFQENLPHLEYFFYQGNFDRLDGFDLGRNNTTQRENIRYVAYECGELCGDKYARTQHNEERGRDVGALTGLLRTIGQKDWIAWKERYGSVPRFNEFYGFPDMEEPIEISESDSESELERSLRLYCASSDDSEAEDEYECRS